jgi:hypothetical protein
VRQTRIDAGVEAGGAQQIDAGGRLLTLLGAFAP